MYITPDISISIRYITILKAEIETPDLTVVLNNTNILSLSFDVLTMKHKLELSVISHYSYTPLN